VTPPSFVDTHCHLDPAYFPDGADAVLDRAREQGVRGFVVIGVGESLAPARFAVELASRRGDVWSVIGVHPHDAKHLDDVTADDLASLAQRPRVVAIGETGLDYHYMHSERAVQGEAFRRQIQLARALRLPIVVHTREAPDDTIDILTQEGAADVGGVIHCFSEDRPFARRALDLGFDLSFSGIVTFKSAVAIQDVAGWAPLDRIHVETDSPYLAPVPRRGKPCEPAYVRYTAARVAELRGLAVEDLAVACRQNAERRFRLTLAEEGEGPHSDSIAVTS
jgi:TatD DNase family protein